MSQQGPVGKAEFDLRTETLVLVLEAVRLSDGVSRADVARATGLTRSVTGSRVSELIGLGLIAENQIGPSSGGRPARVLTFQAQAGYVLVADLGATSITAGVADLAGNILDSRSSPADVLADPQIVMTQLTTFFDELVQDMSNKAGPLAAIGVGVPLPVQSVTGRPVAPPSLHGWDGFMIRETLMERYSTHVWIDNDVNVMALAEWRFGVAKNNDNVVCIKIGTGIGAATITDGVLHRGAQGTAGYIGHIHISDDPTLVCGCGRTGCVEALASGSAIARDAEIAARGGHSSVLSQYLHEQGQVTARDVSVAALRGDQVSIDLLQQSARHVGTVLAALVNIINPSLLVIGGGVADAGDGYLATIRETVYRLSLPLATRDLQIQRAKLGQLGGLVGAAVMAIDHLFSADQAPWPFLEVGGT